MLSFLLACLVIELTPGPNMTYVAGLSSVSGSRAGFSLVAGIAAGLLVIGLVAASGAAALISDNIVIYHVLRWGGVGYMLWLAWESWRGTEKTVVAAGFEARYFRRGFLTNILNPKAALFYMTVFPAFINRQKPEWPQWVLLVLLYVCIATIVHSLLVVLGSRLRPLLEHPGRSRTIGRVFAALLLVVAGWMAWSTRRG